MGVIYPERIFTREQVREVDRRAIEEFGIPAIVLMENASRGVAGHAMKMLDWPNQAGENRVAILCGAGNNGGDGLAAARHLQIAMLRPTIVLCQPVEKLTGDAATNLNICDKMEIPIVEAAKDPETVLASLGHQDLVIDALLGTGLTGEVRPPLIQAIEWINKKNDAPVLAVDIPSGMDCDTGLPLGACVAADVTVTFIGIKRGFMQPGARRLTGDIRIVGIGLPRTLVEELGERIND